MRCGWLGLSAFFLSGAVRGRIAASAWVAGFCEYTKLCIKIMNNAFAPVRSQKNPGEKKSKKK